MATTLHQVLLPLQNKKDAHKLEEAQGRMPASEGTGACGPAQRREGTRLV